MGAYSRTGGRTVARTASRTNDEERGARRSTAARSLALASSAKDPLGPSLPSVCPSVLPGLDRLLPPSLPPGPSVPSLSLPKDASFIRQQSREGRGRSMLRRRHISSAPLPTRLLLYSYVYLSPRPPALRTTPGTERTPRVSFISGHKCQALPLPADDVHVHIVHACDRHFEAGCDKSRMAATTRGVKTERRIDANEI